MQDTAIKNFCIWARRELMAQVALQARRFGIREDGYDAAGADTVEGRPLTVDERRQRADLIRRLGPADAPGYEEAYKSLIDQAAYTWFNRLIAIRFMELNDRLPSHVRMLSAADGAFRPQALREALDVPIEGLDAAQVSELLQASDDEALFRCLFLAQCRELAACLPDVFEPVGAAMELLLPEGLLRQGSVVQRLVDDIPEEDWREGVEIVGWMYQYYVSERKREVFDGYQRGQKAEREDIPPATQTFTPDWIVGYMVENTLGRVWMLNHPNSFLAEEMPFYIKPEGDVESFPRAVTPESLTFCDPCCGSGHILAKAFDLLMAMYDESGYTKRDAVRSILENNLYGMEIDKRARSLASFELAMKACEYDPRFLKRGVAPHMTWLEPTSFSEEELMLLPELMDLNNLLDANAHLDECGSLFAPSPEEIVAVNTAIARLEDKGDLFADAVVCKLRAMLGNCLALSKHYSIVVTNPPYMGSSNMNKWLSAWVKKNYATTSKDLCTCFIERCVGMLEFAGCTGLATTNSWMFLSSFEKLRKKLIENHTLTSLVQLSVHGFKGIAAQVCAFTISEDYAPGLLGGFVRLNDFDHHSLQEKKTLEAIANPTCGWFYRRSTDAFKSIPGTPIAYWASDTIGEAFRNGVSLSSIGTPRQGLATGENARFVRQWWEVSQNRSRYDCASIEESVQSGCRWFPYNKGGDYRKWYGNNDCVVNWENDGQEIREFADDSGKQLSRPQNTQHYFRPSITWSKISSGAIAFRYKPWGHVFDVAGTSIFAEDAELLYLQGACNSSVIFGIASMLSPTLNFEVGQISTYPIIDTESEKAHVIELVQWTRKLSKDDWDASEASWDFRRHMLV